MSDHLDSRPRPKHFMENIGSLPAHLAQVHAHPDWNLIYPPHRAEGIPPTTEENFDPLNPELTDEKPQDYPDMGVDEDPVITS